MQKLTLLLVASALLLYSCSHKLDLIPQQNTTSEMALSSDASVKRVLRGAYDAASDSYVLGGNLMLFSELLAANGEIKWEGSFTQPREVFNKKILVTNSYLAEGWLKSFQTIHIANSILSALDVVTEKDRERVKGEALLLRAIIYFELVQLYAPPYSAGNVTTALGLPLVLSPTVSKSDVKKISRNTLEETYTQIVKDMTEAEEILPISNGVFLNKMAASGYLSRVFLQMGNYEKALEFADKGIDLATKNGYDLVATYADAFNNAVNSREDLFSIQVSEQDGSNNMQLFWSVPEYGARDGDVSIEAKHLILYKPGDARLHFFYTSNGAARSGKWKLRYKNISLFRLAELYLTRAECNIRLFSSIGDDPADDLNLIRKRSGLIANPNPSLSDILHERKLELAHEGQAIHDLKRLKGKTDGVEFDAPNLVLPIPQREIAASEGALKQNEGY
ncbi:RagB/SusD family nutrient uptake outer membrane protein [Dyadobacter chenwenxiniae]|uniref:RagB/SusD family nutrient uptake outer membrane protein n=1 Tax=Dyadobacter chenwenxiniae TaxID=2906456 RepID=A0A9X1PQ81_9BACT|nr:RagB/SusD family nutrient uptake outer membrane protein [Dyadobacter chenwenxiniae]MCF0064414.1 RagB/SusD family nutrient uptake outer membrane protein [Dyadobacter chenwenxiniae]UON82380.1 RagB/SusD family nutrient uptake outer membrane protein [Dyadobacter chenwenxiniae]